MNDSEILDSLRGSLKKHITDKEIHEVRERVFKEYFDRDNLMKF